MTATPPTVRLLVDLPDRAGLRAGAQQHAGDLANDFLALSVGGKISGRINPAGDVDYFSFVVPAGFGRDLGADDQQLGGQRLRGDHALGQRAGTSTTRRGTSLNNDDVASFAELLL